MGTLKELTTISVAEVTVASGDGNPVSARPIATKSLAKALDGGKPALWDPPVPTKDLNDDIAELLAEVNAGFHR